MVFLDVYMYRANFSKEITSGKYFILPGSEWTPLYTNGSEK